MTVLRVYSSADVAHAWAAGFIDGEGSIGLKRRSAGGDDYSPRMSAAQVVRGPLDRLATLFGGYVRGRPPQRDGWREQFVWEMTGAQRVGDALRTLAPFLVVKRADAEVVLRYIGLMRVGAYSRLALTDDERLSRAACRDELIALRRPDMAARMAATR